MGGRFAVIHGPPLGLCRQRVIPQEAPQFNAQGMASLQPPCLALSSYLQAMS